MNSRSNRGFVRLTPGDIVEVLHRGQPTGELAIVRACCARFCTADDWPQDIGIREPLPLFDDADQFRLIRKVLHD